MLTKENTKAWIAIQDLDKFTAIDAAINYTHLWNEHMDWHEFSAWFTRLHVEGKLILIGHKDDGMCVYKWKGEITNEDRAC